MPLRDGGRLGPWEVVATPGRAPSHVCVVDARRGVILLADLLAPRLVPWFDYGYTPDPVGEYLGSLDRVAALGTLALALPGHGRALEDLGAAIADHQRRRCARSAPARPAPTS